MRVIVFDTETTGLPNGSDDLDTQPYICQFAAIIYEYSAGEWEEAETIDIIIRPEIPIPLMATALHGISDEDVADKETFGAYVHQIIEAFQTSDVAVAHNISFDQKMMEIELLRLGRSKQFLPEQTFDTMLESREVCQIPGKNGNFRSPKLMALHEFLFNEKFERAHNALNDVRATARCLQELASREVFSPIEPSQGALF
mgnify:CR=1 FL=1|jgi:DNA polymerase III epsilon subunit-like protein